MSIQDEINKSNALRVKIFNSDTKRIDYLEDKINNWLLENSHVEIKNILTTANAAAYGGSESFYAEELYLIVIYQEK
jgi:hypothetical protein